MNKFYFTVPDVNQGIQLPLEIKWDFDGRTDSIELYEDEVIKEVIGIADDFEIARFSHKEDIQTNKTEINYEFNFFNGIDVQTSVSTDWINSYLAEGFTTEEIYFYKNPFTKSFFKLDFYNTPDTKTQTNYFTVILPTQQGDVENASISPIPPFDNVPIKKPKYKLDFVGDKEGFFLYWLRKTEFLNINTFYMSAKFFDAKLGVFVKMMNRPQSSLPVNQFQFNPNDYFYYKVELDYTNKTYQVFDYLNVRVGTNTPIIWYEYVNPPQ